MEFDGLDSLQSKGLSGVFSITVQKHQFFGAQLSCCVQFSHPYMTTRKTIALTRRTFVGKVMPLLSKMLSAAKSFQSCPTLCNPMDGSPPGSPVPGFLQARTLTNLDRILKSRDIILPTKVHLVKAMVFPVVMYGCDS